MNQDLIKQRCQSMEVAEIVRALTVELDESSLQFREVAQSELAARGVEMSIFIDTVTVALNEAAAEELTVDLAVALVDGDLQSWDALLCTSCLGDTLVVQKEQGSWVLHVYEAERYEHSHFATDPSAVKELLKRFLRLTSWQELAGEAHHLDNWKLLLASDARETIDSVVADLVRVSIPCTVQTPLFSGDGDGYLQILVPKEHLEIASDIVDETEESLYEIYERVEAADAAGDRKLELELYDLLAEEDPENAAVFYNRGHVLMELTRFEEAAEALAEAVSIGLKTVERLTDPMGGSGGLGGIFGLVAILFRKLTKPPPEKAGASAVRYPDYLDDTEILLQQLEPRLPNHIKTQHCLAAIARMKNNAAVAEAHYRRILELNPDDQVAYFNLGYLHSERGGQDAS
jgi:tetratricopeptide (TPR) repeat protein